jgi:lipopolysaccharide export system protein LptA
MSARVERLRLGLIAGSVVLLLVLAGTYSYARYRAARNWIAKAKKLQHDIGNSVVRESDGVTFSQSLKDKTVVTIHAAKQSEYQDGHVILHDVVITIYGLHDNRTDRVYGKEFEWNEKEGVARAVGEVQMDLQVPSGIAASQQRHGSPATAGGAGANSIHVRTSGLEYLNKLGVAATKEQVEFHYGGLTCIAQGAEFDSNPSALHLLADVHMSGVMRGKPIALTATKADFDRETEIASFAQPVVTSEDRKAHSQSAVLHLRKDGSVERAEAIGDVALDSGMQHLTAPRLDATLDEKNQPQTAKLSGGVRFVGDDVTRPTHGEAGEVRLRFDAEGRPTEVTAVNGAHLLERVAAENGVWLDREMRGDQIVSTLHAEGKEKPQLQHVHISGTASLRGDSLAKPAGVQPRGLKSTNITGDDLLMSFVPTGGAPAKGTQKVRLDKLHAQGHTVLRQTAALGEEHTSSGDTLDAVFAAGSTAKQAEQLSVASAIQVGHIAISSRSAPKPGAKAKQPELATANAERAVYDGDSERLSLFGGVHLAESETSIVADSVMLDQRSGDAEAHGNVTATISGSGAQATHVAAQQAFLHKSTQVAEFEGSGAKPARMWQDASQVEAANITLDQQNKTLVARPVAGGTVHSVFAGEPAKPNVSQTGTKRAPSILRVESRLLEYSDAEHQAVFSGPVRIEGALGDVQGQRTTVFFTPMAKGSGKSGVVENGLMGGSLDHVVVSGDVKLEQPGKHGTGEQLVYKAADQSFVLTGTPNDPPRIVDTQQGTVTGASLLFRAGDSTIVVAGATAAEGQSSQRARIDTRVRRKAK